MDFVEAFNPNSIKFEPDTRSDMPIFHREVEEFCQLMANGLIGPAICWYRLTNQKHKSMAQAKTLANKLVGKHPEIEYRIAFIKGDLACIEAYKHDFSREDLGDILISCIKDTSTHSRDIASLSTTLMSLKGWTAPTQIEVKSDLTTVLEGLSVNAALPMYDQSCIDIQATPVCLS